MRTTDPKTGLILAFIGLALLIYVATEPSGLLGIGGQPSAGSPVIGFSITPTPRPSLFQLPTTPTATTSPRAAAQQLPATPTQTPPRPPATEVVGTPEPPRVLASPPATQTPVAAIVPPAQAAAATATAAAPKGATAPAGSPAAPAASPAPGSPPAPTAPPAPTSTPAPPTATPTLTPSPTTTPTITATPSPTLPVRFTTQGVNWLSSCEATLVRIFLRDKSGNPVNGQKFRVATRDGSWSALSDPTGKAGRFEPGWTGLQIANSAKAGEWALWPADDAGLPLSPPLLFETMATDCQPGAPGQQIGTVFWSKNF